VPEEEEDDGAGIAGLPVMLGLARMTLEAIRISGTRRGSEGVAGRGVSQRSGHGGFGHEGKKSRGVRGREQGGKGADEGVPGGCRGILSRSGAGRQAGGGSGACVRAAATRSSFCPRTKTTGEATMVGWATGVGPGGLRGERQVLLSLSLFF